jgi:hypothetical protein
MTRDRTALTPPAKVFHGTEQAGLPHKPKDRTAAMRVFPAGVTPGWAQMDLPMRPAPEQAFAPHDVVVPRDVAQAHVSKYSPLNIYLLTHVVEVTSNATTATSGFHH